MSGNKKTSWISVVEIIVIIILALMIVGMIAMNVLFKNDGSAKPIFGVTVYKTKAVNMVPEIPVNTVVLAKSSEINNIHERSVILCKMGGRTTLTRVVRIEQEEGKTYYVVKFDTSPATETFRIDEEAVIAKAVWQLEAFGKFLDFATSTKGIIIAVVIPLFLIILFQVIRIVNIRKLENEASYYDDIDELILSRDANKDEESQVTLTEPKFIEDITGKIDIPKPVRYEPEQKPEPKLNINSKGIAEYSVNADENKTRDDKLNAALFSYDKLPSKNAEQKKPVTVGAGRGEYEREELYSNRPTKIEPKEQKSRVDDFFDTYTSKKSTPEKSEVSSEGKVVFTPHISNVIPEKLVNVQAEAVAPKQSSFDDSVKEYYDKSSAKVEDEAKYAEAVLKSAQQVNTIPEMAVVPKETLAPPKKKKNNKTLDELMSLIDAEESKLKK